MIDPIPSAVQEVVDLFASELASLKFGDLEPAGLAAASDEIKTIATGVMRAEAELENARTLLAEKRDALLQKAQRALAYARVYAENRPELAARLERISLPRSPRRSSKVESMLPDTALSGTPEATLPSTRRRGRSRREPDLTPADDVGASETAATG
jgi:hypothetical protein